MVEVKLTCNGCGETAQVKPHFMLTKLGSLRIEGYGRGWQVDGNGALCYSCCPAYPHVAQTETWSEYDRHNVIQELIREGEPTVTPPTPEQQAVADALSRL